MKYDAERKRSYDKGKSDDSFRTGEEVMYNISSRFKGNVKKLIPNFIGPYEIVRSFNDGQNYDIRNVQDQSEITVHRKHLRRYTNDDDTPAVAVITVLQDEASYIRENLSTVDKQSQDTGMGRMRRIVEISTSIRRYIA